MKIRFNFKNISGFTLIEIMVSVLILALISSMIVALNTNSQAKSQADLLQTKIFAGTIKNKLAQNLVGDWSFYEGTGSAIHDSSDYQNNGTITGASWATSSSCVENNCLSFDGNDYVTFNTFTDISNLPAYTISAWMKVNTSANLEVAIGYGSTASVNPVVLIGKHSDNKAIFQHRDDAGNIIQIFSDNVINDNKWHLVTGIRYASNNHRILVDGVMQSMTDTDTIGVTTENRSVLGMLPRASNSYFYNGLVDEVSVYSSAYTVSQIQEKYLAGLSNLLNSGQISEQEYNQRLAELQKQIAKR
ncbi:MAG: LamG-like jellyroll fold domain-containing protein [Candidatus Paceibacterota bacterium]